jgi:hypothetical protein
MRPVSFFCSLLILPVLVSAQQPNPGFEAQTIDDKVEIGYGLAIGDVDGDGKPDILLADKKQFVWYRNGDWKRFVMVDNLTEQDNVCIAARDIDGDGKVEVAVGAQWNPGETTDLKKSGSVHYLIRPKDPTQPWEAVELPHEPTVHRMRWAQTGKGSYQLVVVPLHGRGNKGGEGAGVKVMAYEKPKNPRQPWRTVVLNDAMHMTHNFELIESPEQTQLLIGGKEGITRVTAQNGRWQPDKSEHWEGPGIGEIRSGRNGKQVAFLAAVEPMHGNQLTVYAWNGKPGERRLLEDGFKEAHALACADLLGLGRDQIVVGWRNPNANNQVGVQLFVPQDNAFTQWEPHWIDENTMACEDLMVADLDGDGRPDIVAAGRATKNLKIYWNRTPAQPK